LIQRKRYRYKKDGERERNSCHVCLKDVKMIGPRGGEREKEQEQESESEIHAVCA
jgi:hypothetical protein